MTSHLYNKNYHILLVALCKLNVTVHSYNLYRYSAHCCVSKFHGFAASSGLGHTKCSCSWVLLQAVCNFLPCSCHVCRAVLCRWNFFWDCPGLRDQRPRDWAIASLLCAETWSRANPSLGCLHAHQRPKNWVTESYSATLKSQSGGTCCHPCL